jgi:hypothetical protein
MNAEQIKEALKEVFGPSVEVEVLNLMGGEPTEADMKAAAQAKLEKALAGVREQMAACLERYELFKKLESSLLTPLEERTATHMVREISLMMQLRLMTI